MKPKKDMGKPGSQKGISTSDYPRSLEEAKEINRRIIKERAASKTSRPDLSSDVHLSGSDANAAFRLFHGLFNAASEMQNSLRKQGFSEEQTSSRKQEPSAKQGSSEEQSKTSNPTKKIDSEELVRMEREHAARMAFLSDSSDKALTPEVLRLKSLLEVLLFRGRELWMALMLKYRPEASAAVKENAAAEARVKEFRNIQVRSEYQFWYTEALAAIKLVLPSRVDDFVGLYEYPAKRSKLTKINFRIADAMRGCVATEKIRTVIGDVEKVVADWSTCDDLVLTQCDILEAAAAAQRRC